MLFILLRDYKILFGVPPKFFYCIKWSVMQKRLKNTALQYCSVWQRVINCVA